MQGTQPRAGVGQPQVGESHRQRRRCGAVSLPALRGVGASSRASGRTPDDLSAATSPWSTRWGAARAPTAGWHRRQRRRPDLLAPPAPLLAASCRNPSKLWTPTSERSSDFGSRVAPESVIYAGQGPPPPSPLVVERFQQVISQLFQQVGDPGASLQHAQKLPGSRKHSATACRASAALARTTPPAHHRTA